MRLVGELLVDHKSADCYPWQTENQSDCTKLGPLVYCLYSFQVYWLAKQHPVQKEVTIDIQTFSYAVISKYLWSH